MGEGIRPVLEARPLSCYCPIRHCHLECQNFAFIMYHFLLLCQCRLINVVSLTLCHQRRVSIVSAFMSNIVNIASPSASTVSLDFFICLSTPHVPRQGHAFDIAREYLLLTYILGVDITDLWLLNSSVRWCCN